MFTRTLAYKLSQAFTYMHKMHILLKNTNLHKKRMDISCNYQGE